jgi:hypothetical protein
MLIIGVKVRMNVIRGYQNSIVPKSPVVVKEDQNHRVEVGKILGFNPENNEITVKNQETDQVQIWNSNNKIKEPKEMIDNKNFQLDVAAAIILEQAKENEELRKEIDNQDKSLNLLA